jgi:M6 family metalloprotease-like protein
MGALSRLNAATGFTAATSRVEGTFSIPVVLVRPSNVPEPFPASRYRSLLFDDAPTDRPYSLRSFYAQMSNGSIHLQGTVVGWWQAPQPNTYYEDGCNGVGVLRPCPNFGRLGELLVGALQQVDDGTFDWGRFDNDGPDGVPNSGDDDGYVDFVNFIHPDVDGACRTSHIWAHRWVISVWNGGVPYQTRSARRGGGRIVVDDYTMQSGVGGSSACAGTQVMPIGTVAHETGHAFGLPDLYDTEPSSRASQGIGEWGLMGSGNYRSPDSPARFEAWSLAEMGWVALDTLTGSRTVTTGPVTRSDTVFVVPLSGRDEYYLIENRQALESDSALLNPLRAGGRVPGLLVWHIDRAKVESDGFGTTNSVNSGAVHGVALVQADGFNELRAPGTSNRGDSGDPFPGTTDKRRLSWTTNPRAEDNASGFAGFMLDRIEQLAPAGSMRFRFTRRGLSVIASEVANGTVSVNGTSLNRFEDVLAAGELLSVAAPLTLPGETGSAEYRFRAWSNGRPASFTLEPDPLHPDTLIAKYDKYHMMVARIFGTGSVSVTPEAAPRTTSGYFVWVQAGTPVTLSASPADGAQFLGWVGDTTATDPVLRLPMTRPFEVVATFSVSPAVLSLAQAIEAMLGDPGLLPLDVRDGLDWLGNRSNLFDLGDVLAMLTRSRATASASLVRQVLEQRLAGEGGR